jgi:predicted RNA-binding Zn ribbon-like protein
MRTGGPPDLTVVLADPRRAANLRTEDVPALLAALEQVRAALWARMLRAPAPDKRDLDSAVGEQLLTVAEAAAELRFTPGYV